MGALDGIRVLDFTRVLAGPSATRLLADFGAEVIKVQSRVAGASQESNTTPYFRTYNRNKLGVTLDLGKTEARELALKLAQRCDVIIENFSPRVMSNWGLDYERLREAKPDIIMCSLSAAGQTGPWCDAAAFAPTIHALSGMTYLTSFSADRPLGPGASYADHVAGLYGAFAILTALEYRDLTGKGQHIDLSEYESMSGMLAPALMAYMLDGKTAAPQGNAPDYSVAAPHGCYRCAGADRWCVISVHTEEEWRAFCHTLGDPAWSREKRFSTTPLRQQNAGELDRLIGEWTAALTPEQVTSRLQEAGVRAGVVKNASDLAADPQLTSRQFFVPLPPGDTMTDASPIRLSGSPAEYRRAAPLPGQDNDPVFRELLGLTGEEIAGLAARGVIG